jgi:Mg2+/Co2+ transporter CorB
MMSEVRWLIEKGSPATYLKSMGLFEFWTDNADEAIGFCRERDAVEIMKAIRATARHYLRVCDHVFLDEQVPNNPQQTDGE